MGATGAEAAHDEERCASCGRPADDGSHEVCRYDPPRYCVRCGRRLRVQVLPDGFRAACPRCDRA